jgi:hypothetical protein
VAITDDLIGNLTKKFGIDASSAKGALDKVLPFVKDKLGGLDLDSIRSKLGQGTHSLLAHVDKGEHDRHVDDVAKATGLAPAMIRDIQQEAAAMAAQERILEGQQELAAKLAKIQADAAKKTP